MNEPGTIAGYCTGAAIALPCSLLGANTDAFLVGLIASIIISLWLGTIDSKLKATCAVLFSSLLAAYVAPQLAKYLASWIPALGTDISSLRQCLAFVLGGLGPTVIPIAITAVGRKVERLP